MVRMQISQDKVAEKSLLYTFLAFLVCFFEREKKDIIFLQTVLPYQASTVQYTCLLSLSAMTCSCNRESILSVLSLLKKQNMHVCVMYPRSIGTVSFEADNSYKAVRISHVAKSKMLVTESKS